MSIRLENITKKYTDGSEAVSNISFDIKTGEFIALVGPSGCGKSTTLNMIAGLETITTGKLYMNDMVVNDKSPRERGIAMVFQSYALYPHKTIWENIAFPLQLAKLAREDINSRVDKIANLLAINNILNKKPANISGGQRQRAAMARALVRNPKVLLLDEPLSNLDARLRVQMRTEIGRLHKNMQTTTIYVTHDQTEAMSLADRIVILDKGKIQQIGAPQDLYYQPKNTFVAGFIGTAPMNFIPAEAQDNYLITEYGKLEVGESIIKSLLLKDNKVLLGIRSESFLSSTENGIDSTSLVELTGSVYNIDEFGFDKQVYLIPKSGLKSDVNTKRMLTARLKRQHLTKIGEVLRLKVAIDSIYYFDINSGLRLK